MLTVGNPYWGDLHDLLNYAWDEHIIIFVLIIFVLTMCSLSKRVQKKAIVVTITHFVEFRTQRDYWLLCIIKKHTCGSRPLE